MNPWAHADRFRAISDAADHRAQVEDQIAEIAGALSVAGEYLTRIDVHPAQAIVDFSWAARQAGRRLGIQVDVTSQIIKADGQLQVRVRAITPSS